MPQDIVIIDRRIRFDKSELLMEFNGFDLADWPHVWRTPGWRVEDNRLVGGSADEDTYGEIFYKTPIQGDVVLEFDAEILAPSYHDMVWFWNTRLYFGEEQRKHPEIWGEGYLGCLGGWYGDLAGIERLPGYRPSVIAPSCPVEPGRSYHIVSGGCGARQFIVIDGRLVTFFTDPQTPDPSEPGFIGFGIFESCVAYSNLKVWRPYVENVPLKYVPGTKYRPGNRWSVAGME
ncbi:MAG: hypothetical protein MJ025_00450 [Victivallaceae bacterium]|nr:hypothetical protein [Victivallaceae bacterium]